MNCYALRPKLPEDLLRKEGILYEYCKDLHFLEVHQKHVHETHKDFLFQMGQNLNRDVLYIHRNLPRIRTDYNASFGEYSDDEDPVSVADITDVFDDSEFLRNQCNLWLKNNLHFIEAFLDHKSHPLYAHVNFDKLDDVFECLRNEGVPEHLNEIDLYISSSGSEGSESQSEDEEWFSMPSGEMTEDISLTDLHEFI